jgi:hypothetical protein
MTRPRFPWIAGTAAFLLLVAYTTVVSLPESPPQGLPHDAGTAERVCRGALTDSLEGARFPFPATIAYQPEGGYHLTGTIESPQGGEMVRANFDCRILYQGSGEYLAERVHVWRSH